METTIKSELSMSEVLHEKAGVLPERNLMRHRRRHPGATAVATNGSGANAASVDQFGIGNTSTINQTNNITNIVL